jgi:competence protein ComGC
MKAKFVYFFTVLFLVTIALAATASPQPKPAINTVQTMVSYSDLEQIMKTELSKYFLLPLTEYEDLKAKKEANLKLIAEQEAQTPPPVDFNIKSAKLFARLIDDLAFIEASFTIEKLTDSYLELPILKGRLAIEGASLNNQEIFLGSRLTAPGKTPNANAYWNRYLTVSTLKQDTAPAALWPSADFLLPLSSKGVQECKINFIVPINQVEDRQQLLFNLYPTPITFIKLEAGNLALSMIESSIASYNLFSNQGITGTEIIGWAGAQEKIELVWRQKPIIANKPEIETVLEENEKEIDEAETQKPSQETPEPKKAPVWPTPLVYANSHTLISVGQTAIYGQKEIVYSISKAPIYRLVFEIPENLEITKVQGRGEVSYRKIKENQRQYLQVNLQAARLDNYSIKIFYEMNIDSEATTIALPELSPVDIERELGSIAIESIGTAELQGGNNVDNPLAKGVFAVDPMSLPSKLRGLAIRPIILAFNHSTSPTNIELDIKRYQVLEQKTVAADKMDVQTTFTTNSTSNTLITLNLRNNNKQYLLMQLASGSEVVSTLRDGKPIKTVSSKIPGMVQIPLEISQVPHKPASMELQIALKNPIEPMKWKGELGFSVPQLDVPVSKFNWTLYAPENYRVFGLKGSVDEVADDMPPFFIVGFNGLVNLLSDIISNPGLFMVWVIIILLVLFALIGKRFLKGLKACASAIGGAFKATLRPSTLVSLGIVLIAVVVLSSLSVPNFKKAREQARDKACFSNQRVITGAIEMFEMDNGPLTSFDLNRLSDAGYMRGVPQCPEHKGAYSITHNKQVYCTFHGTYTGETLDQLRAQDHKIMGIRRDAPQMELFKAKETTNRYADSFSPSVGAPSPASKGMRKPQVSTPPAPTPQAQQSFGSTKRTEMMPIKTLFVTTKNSHQLARDLVIPEINADSTLAPSATHPELRLCYMYNSITKGFEALAFLLALMAGAFMAASAMYNQKNKLAAATIIMLALSAADLKLGFLGNAANYGFWLALALALALKTIALLKARLTAANGPDAPLAPINGNCSKNPCEGSASFLLLLTLSCLLLLAPIAGMAAEKEIRILAPFKELSSLVPADGKSVFLTEEDYNYLKDIKEIKEPENKQHSYSFKLNLVKYQGIIEEKRIKIKAKFELELFKKDWKAIPLLPANVIPTEAKLNGEPHALSMVKTEQGVEHYGIVTNEEGQKSVEIDFFVMGKDEGAAQRNLFILGTVPTTISILELEIPQQDSIALLKPGVIKKKETRDGTTWVGAIIPPTPTFSIEIVKESIEEVVEPEPEEIVADAPKIEIIEEPTRVSVRTNSLVDVKESFVRLVSDMELNVRGTHGIESFSVQIPAGTQITDVSNAAIVEDWRVSEETGLLEIAFHSVIKGSHRLKITVEAELLGDREKEYSVPELVPVGVEQSQGMLGVGCLEELEVSLKGAPAGYSPINTGDFARIWKSAQTEKLPYAFRYLRHPNELRLAISRPESIEMLSAAIDRAEAVSLISDEGYVITRVKYLIRNNSEQFLKVKLPRVEGAELRLWDSRAAGKPVNTGFDASTETYNVPIIISPRVSGEAHPYFAEITYAYKKEELGNFAKRQLALPRVHLPIAELEWGIYVNHRKEIIKLDGNLDMTEGRRLGFIFNQEGPIEDILRLANREQSDGEGTGILPVRFELPLAYEYVSFNLLQLDPDKAAPNLELLITGPSRTKTLSYMLFFIGMGILAGACVIQVFTSGRRWLWLAIALLVAAPSAVAIATKLYSATLAIDGLALSITLYLLYRFLGKKTHE